MARYAKGKHAVLISDRSGWKIKYRNARTEWTGARVSKEEWEEKQPQLDPQKWLRRADGQGNVLYDPRPNNDKVPTTARLGPLYSAWSGQTAITLGQINVGVSEDVPGFQLTTSQGTVKLTTVVIPGGLPLTSSQGTVTISGDEIPDGMYVTATRGDVTLSSIEVPTGLYATATQGSIIISSAEDSEGFELTSSQGSVVLDLTEVPDGLYATATQGSVTIPGIEVPDGMYVTATQGTVKIAGIEVPDGMYVTATQGTVTALEVTTVTINASSLNMTATRGTMGVTSPSWGNFTWGHDTWGQ